MIGLVAVNIGIPVIFLAVRLISHAVDPKSYGPAGGYDIFTSLVLGFLYVFGFIVAAVVGCTAGSVDLTDGMFRHLVITGRSRIALYFARIPAGLAIVIGIVAIGYTIVCAVCVFAAPAATRTTTGSTSRRDSRVPPWTTPRRRMPTRSSATSTSTAARDSTPPTERALWGRTDERTPAGIGHPDEGRGTMTGPLHTSQAQVRAFAITVANQDYASYSVQFHRPVHLVHVRRRTVDRFGSDDRVHRRARAGVTHGTADRPRDPPHRARVHFDADLQPRRDRLHAQRPAVLRGGGDAPYRAARPPGAVRRWRRRSLGGGGDGWTGCSSDRSPPWCPSS